MSNPKIYEVLIKSRERKEGAIKFGNVGVFD
jgi:hypothetical protein